MKLNDNNKKFKMKWIYLGLSILFIILFFVLLIVISIDPNKYYTSLHSEDVALIGICSLSLIFSIISLVMFFIQRKKDK